MANNTDLLHRVEDEYARTLKYPSFYKMLQDMPGYFPGEIEKVIDDIAQRYAEAYHAARIQEHGEAFTEEQVRKGDKENEKRNII